MIGLERSQAFLDTARRKAEAAGVQVQFVHGNMAELTYADELDAVVLWGNTFGMLSDDDNFKTLHGSLRTTYRPKTGLSG